MPEPRLDAPVMEQVLARQKQRRLPVLELVEAHRALEPALAVGAIALPWRRRAPRTAVTVGRLRAAGPAISDAAYERARDRATVSYTHLTLPTTPYV